MVNAGVVATSCQEAFRKWIIFPSRIKPALENCHQRPLCQHSWKIQQSKRITVKRTHSAPGSAVAGSAERKLHRPPGSHCPGAKAGERCPADRHFDVGD